MNGVSQMGIGAQETNYAPKYTFCCDVLEILVVDEFNDESTTFLRAGTRIPPIGRDFLCIVPNYLSSKIRHDSAL